MDKQTIHQSRARRAYSVVPYDKEWAKIFLRESQKIKKALGKEILETHHVGSTSVPGVSGKPTVDILFVVSGIKRIDSYIPDMQKIGYTSLGDFVAQDARLFVMEKDSARLVNVHFFEKNHPEVLNFLAVRDYLIAHTEEQKMYGNVKEHLFQKYPSNYSEYRKQKDVYLKNLAQRAITWYTRNNH